MTLFLKKRFMVKERTGTESQQETVFLTTKQSGEQYKSSQEQNEYEVVETEIKPAHIICPDCGGITIEGLDYCHRCGGELKPTD